MARTNTPILPLHVGFFKEFGIRWVLQCWIGCGQRRPFQISQEYLLGTFLFLRQLATPERCLLFGTRSDASFTISCSTCADCLVPGWAVTQDGAALGRFPSFGDHTSAWSIERPNCKVLPFPNRGWGGSEVNAVLLHLYLVKSKFKHVQAMLNLLEPNLFRQKSAMKKSSWKQFQQFFWFRWFRCGKKWSTCSNSCTSCVPLSCSTLMGFWQCAKIPRDRIVCL